jgi:hypothetical protein
MAVRGIRRWLMALTLAGGTVTAGAFGVSHALAASTSAATPKPSSSSSSGSGSTTTHHCPHMGSGSTANGSVTG